LAAKILTKFKRRIFGFELEPSSGGCFEFSIDDQIVFSKLESGHFPKEEDIVAEISQRLKPS